jgi:hypothetical protein
MCRKTKDGDRSVNGLDRESLSEGCQSRQNDGGKRFQNADEFSPNGTAEEIVLDLFMQCLDQLLSSLKLERDHVNDYLRVKACNPRTEFTFCLFGPTVHGNLFNGLPGRRLPVGCRCTTTDVYNVVSTLDERGHEIGSDVSTPSNDDDPSHSFLPSLSTFVLQTALTCTPRPSENSETIL